MTLKDVARFSEVAARAADRTQGDGPSRKAARGILRQMEEDYPGIAGAAARAETAMLDPFAGATSAGPSDTRPSFRDMIQNLGVNAAQRFAAGFEADLIDETRRQQPLVRGEVTVKRHECAADQVCVEVRCRARDWLKVRKTLLQIVEQEIEDAAAEG